MNFVQDDSIATELAANTYSSTNWTATSSGWAAVSGNKLRITGVASSHASRLLYRFIRTYQNIRAVAFLDAGDITTNGNTRILVGGGTNPESMYYLLEVTPTGVMSMSVVSPQYGDYIAVSTTPTATVNGTDPFRIEVIKTGSYPPTLTLNVYNAAAGEIGAGAVLVGTVSLDTTSSYCRPEYLQGSTYVGLVPPGSAVTKIYAGLILYDDQDSQVPFPSITQNDAAQISFTALFGRSGLHAATTVQYRLHRAAGSSDFAASGATALAAYQPSATLTDATGAANTAYAYKIGMYDGTTEVYSVPVFVTAKRSGTNILTLGHSYVQGTGASVVPGTEWVSRMQAMLTGGYLGSAPRTCNVVNRGVGGTTINNWMSGRFLLFPAIQAGIAGGCRHITIQLQTNDIGTTDALLWPRYKTTTDRLKTFAQFTKIVCLATPGTLDGKLPLARARSMWQLIKANIHDGQRVFCVGDSLIETFASNIGPSGQTNPTPKYTAGVNNPSSSSYLAADNLHPNDYGMDVIGGVAAEAIINADVAPTGNISVVPADVRRGMALGNGQTGSLDVPAPGQVVSGVAVDGMVGTRTDALGSNVLVANGPFGDPASPITPTAVANNGYPLLSPNVVLFGVDLGNGSKGNVGLPVEDTVTENTPYGPATALKLGRYRLPDRKWYLSDGPSFGPIGSLIAGDAVAPDTMAVLTGYGVRKNGITSPGRYMPPAKSSYLTTGPGYGVDGAETGTATGGTGTTTVLILNQRRRNMIYNQPSSNLASVAIDGTTPAKLFASREGEGGWGCANNTGQAVYFLECRPGEPVTAATVRAAGRKVADGDVAEGGSRRGDVYALLASAGNAALYPQQYSQAV